MGSYYNARALDWFEHGRTELLRHLGLPYAELEQRGVFLPVIEAWIRYRGRARYDDLLEMTTSACFVGRARLRCDVRIVQARQQQDVAEGHTIHAFTDRDGRPIRPPGWLIAGLMAVPTETRCPRHDSLKSQPHPQPQ